MKYDFVIVGAGYSGCVLAERIATQLNKKCLIIEKRNHIGGNCYDYYDDNGVLVHKYGPHIFHTQMKKVWEYLSNFTDWIPYEHKVKAVIDGKEVTVPFNFNSIHTVYEKEKAQQLENLLIDTYGSGVKIPILKLRETSNKDLKELADFIYEKVFLGYNLKQWGMKPEELDPSVSGRVPVFLSRDDRYFQDTYQAIPKHGYTKMFQKMIDHKNISVMLQTDYKDVIDDLEYNNLIYTGHIDYYFDFKLGCLPYRTLNFDMRTLDTEFFQSGAQINYPNEHDYTRITEFKHLTKQEHTKTTIAYEYPEEYEFGKNDPYYPIPKKENLALFEKYKELAEIEKNVYFVGRLADYKYYNMDQTVGVALQLFEKKIAKS